MAHQVEWTEAVYEEFCRVAMLSELERGILKARILGHSVTQQAIEFNVSERTINRVHNKLKAKYDIARNHSAILPERITGTVL